MTWTEIPNILAGIALITLTLVIGYWFGGSPSRMREHLERWREEPWEERQLRKRITRIHKSTIRLHRAQQRALLARWFWGKG
jgi:hypothetical protein